MIGLRGERGGAFASEGVPPSRIVEAKLVRGPAPDRPSAFVHEPVMRVAEKHEVVEIGSATPRPVAHVMGLGKP